jgi:hypothetical protein
MTGHLITLPVRLWLRGARRLLHTAEDVTGRAVMTTLRVAGTLNDLRSGKGRDGRDEPSASPDSTAREQGDRTPQTDALRPEPGTEERAPEADPRIADRAAADPVPAQPETNGAPETLAGERLAQEGTGAAIDLEADDRAPGHVSEQATIVRESAEPGAQEGAGATIRVQEPWPGYSRMNVRDVVARLGGAPAAELAAVQLYETGNRRRQTVLQAVQRELRAAANRDR